MTKFCKNCGAYLPKDTKFCPDCGKSTISYCLKCGGHMLPGQNFCPDCGTKTTRMSKPLTIIIIVVAIIAVVGVVSFFTIDFTEMQEVQVDTFSFNIPSNFEEDTLNAVNEKNQDIKTKSKIWIGEDDFIEIEVISSKNSKFNATEINDEFGGEEANIMGYDGYFNDMPDAYTFSFVKDGKLCTIYTSNPNLFEHMEVN